MVLCCVGQLAFSVVWKVVWKLLFLASGVMIIVGSSLVWDENPFNLEDEALSRFKFDVFVFWLGWALCFFAYYFAAESFVVCAAGLSLAVFTYRQAETTSVEGGFTYTGKTGNLASIPALNMCRTYGSDTSHSTNTAATWDPDFAARNATTTGGYSYSMSEGTARTCTVGLGLMYAGILLAILLGAKSGKRERDSPSCFTKTLGFAVAAAAVCGSAVLFNSDEAKLGQVTFFQLHDQIITVLLAGVYTFLAYWTRQDGLIFASALLAAFCVITNISTMFAITGSTSASVVDVESGFVLNELAMIGACVVCILNKEFMGGGGHTKIVPVMSP